MSRGYAHELTMREAYGEPNVTCPRCKGRGWMLSNNPPTIDCPACDGRAIYNLTPVPDPPKPIPKDALYYVFWGLTTACAFGVALGVLGYLGDIVELLEGMQ